MVEVDPPRVLLVDDRRENRIALQAVLEPLRVEVVEADSGEAALREVLSRDFAVILLDVQMPGIDGLETAELIKARERSRDVPIIFLTAAEADVAQVFAGYEAGAVDYLLKPFDPLVLRSKVSVFADLDRHRRQLTRSTELARNALAAAPSGIALCDLDGLALEVNPALERLLERPDTRLWIVVLWIHAQMLPYRVVQCSTSNASHRCLPKYDQCLTRARRSPKSGTQEVWWHQVSSPSAVVRQG